MLASPLMFCLSASLPTPTSPIEVVVNSKASKPSPVLLLPVVSLISASVPTPKLPTLEELLTRAPPLPLA